MERTSLEFDNPVIKIPQGLLEGFVMKSRKRKEYFGFYGIPYAKNPERFEPPSKWESWNGIRDGTRALSRCIQISKFTKRMLGSENNCLLLNVFTPKFKLADSDQTKGSPLIEPPNKFPVIVFIHGGGFNVGGGDLYGGKFLVDADVILVTLNYRLGVLGFLNTGDGTVPGNMGLKDQVMALRWVQENIKYFSGDKDNVTLMGESAGAACVHFHMMSPMSKGLFSKAIMQSGTALCPWALNRFPFEKLKKLAKQLDLNGAVDHNHMTEVIVKLKRMDAEALAAQRTDYHVWKDNAPVIHFGPSLESGIRTSDTFLSESPQEILSQGKLITDVPLIMGVNGHEGLYRAVPILRDPIKLKALNDHWSNELPAHLMYTKDYVARHEDFATSLRKFYFSNKPIARPNSSHARENLTNLISDRLFNYPLKKSVLLHRNLLQDTHAPNKMYLYYFDYKGHYSYMNGFEVSETYGACHADELQYLMNQRIFYSKITPGSEADCIIEKMVDLWSSFAKTGTPSYHRQRQAWLPVPAEEDLQYFRIDKEDQMVAEPFMERMDFWDKLPTSPTVF